MTALVIIDRQGRRYPVEARPGETVLAASMRHGLHVPYGCRNGTCGTCRARLVEGAVSYPEGRPPALSAEEEAGGYALLCSALPGEGLVVAPEHVAHLPPGMQPAQRRVRVTALEPLSHDVMRIVLGLPGSRPLQFLPGQYLDVLLDERRRRSFSMANPPHGSEHLELHIRRVPDGRFSGQVFESLREKAMLRIEAPLGDFYLRDDSPRPALLMGGGTGLAPLKSILEHLFHRGLDRRVHLYWGVRATRDLYLHDLLTEWRARYEGFEYTPVLSEPDPGDGWTGRTGWVHEALVHDYPDLSGHDVYVAGPPPMIKAARAAFPERGLPASRLYFDSFDYARDDPPAGDDGGNDGVLSGVHR